jgi:RNA polymerase sigma-70 factor (ECF subfamily)
MTQTNSPPLHELLAQARAGNRPALEQLFALCRSYVHVIAEAQAASWLQARVDASDLVQQSMLDAYRGFDQFEGATSQEWLAWLRRIVAHNAADCVRHHHGAAKRQAGREVPWSGADGPSSGLPGADATPSQELLRKERQLLIAEGLARLPEDQRTVILLRNLQRLPFDEVARRMERSRPAAQMLWMRAIRKLQELAADEPSLE